MSENGHVELGDRLRRERSARGLSLRELARRLEVSPSLVSQIETGKIQPSVRTLYAMVSELGVSLDDIFGTDPGPGEARIGRHGAAADLRQAEPSEGEGHVQRAGSRRVIDLEAGVSWERLTTQNEAGVEFLYTVYPPGGESSPADALVRHTGREFGIVLKGRLGLTVGFDDYTLDPGDSASFDSTIPHRLHNEGTETVEAIWFVLGRKP
jgi:transcriptional regulator with XRE-family HTH domain